MDIRRRISLLALSVALVSPALSAQSAAPRRASERRVPFSPGEVLTYDVSWSTYLTAGTATLAVKEQRPSNGSAAFYIVAEAKPGYLLSRLYTLYYKADVLLDASSLLPRRASVYSEEGSRRRTQITSFDQAARTATYEYQASPPTWQQLTLAPYTQDALSALYVLRSIPRKSGDRMTMPVSTGGKNYRVQVVTEARETIKSGIGQHPAWRLVATTFSDRRQQDGRPLRIWLSDTPAQLPLKLQVDLAVGSFDLTLREAQAGPTR